MHDKILKTLRDNLGTIELICQEFYKICQVVKRKNNFSSSLGISMILLLTLKIQGWNGDKIFSSETVWGQGQPKFTVLFLRDISDKLQKSGWVQGLEYGEFCPLY